MSTKIPGLRLQRCTEKPWKRSGRRGTWCCECKRREIPPFSIDTRLSFWFNGSRGYGSPKLETWRVTMLVLTRKLGERVQIGENIWVQVVKIDGNQIRLGIDAPKDVVINREEVKVSIARFLNSEPK